MPFMLMEHAEDPREVLTEKIGDLGTVEVFNNQVLVAIYVRPKVTRSGIHLTDATSDEDKAQGKVGLVVMKGPQACVSDEKWTFPEINLGDWIYFRASDGWAININGTPCRILDDTNVRGRVQHPDQVW